MLLTHVGRIVKQINIILVDNMQAQITEIHPQANTNVLEALAIVEAAAIRENSEWNEQISYSDKLKNENAFLKLQLSTLESRLSTAVSENEELTNVLSQHTNAADTIMKNAHQLNIKADQYERECTQAKNQLSDVEDRLNSYKEIENTPSKIRKKIKTYQDTAKKNQSYIAQHKQTIKDKDFELKKAKEEIEKLCRRVDEIDYSKVYSKDGDNITIFPTLQSTNICGSEVKQVPVLYMNDSGIGAIYVLNEDGEPERSPTPKAGIKPKKHTLELMGTALRKFKRNGNVVHSEDLKMFEGE